MDYISLRHLCLLAQKWNLTLNPLLNTLRSYGCEIVTYTDDVAIDIRKQLASVICPYLMTRSRVMCLKMLIDLIGR